MVKFQNEPWLASIMPIVHASFEPWPLNWKTALSHYWPLLLNAMTTNINMNFPFTAGLGYRRTLNIQMLTTILKLAKAILTGEWYFTSYFITLKERSVVLQLKKQQEKPKVGKYIFLDIPSTMNFQSNGDANLKYFYNPRWKLFITLKKLNECHVKSYCICLIVITEYQNSGCSVKGPWWALVDIRNNKNVFTTHFRRFKVLTQLTVFYNDFCIHTHVKVYYIIFIMQKVPNIFHLFGVKVIKFLLNFDDRNDCWCFIYFTIQTKIFSLCVSPANKQTRRPILRVRGIRGPCIECSTFGI